MNYPALKSLAETHPNWPSANNQVISDWCNEKAKPGVINAAEIRQVVLRTGEYAGIKLASANSSHAGQTIAILAVELLGDREAQVDYSNNNDLIPLQTQTNVLVQTGLISSNTKIVIDSLGLNILPRFSENVKPEDIERVR